MMFLIQVPKRFRRQQLTAQQKQTNKKQLEMTSIKRLEFFLGFLDFAQQVY